MLKASGCNYLFLVKSFYEQNVLDRKDLLFVLVSLRAAGRFYEESLLIKQALRADKGELCEMSIRVRYLSTCYLYIGRKIVCVVQYTTAGHSSFTPRLLN